VPSSEFQPGTAGSFAGRFIRGIPGAEDRVDEHHGVEAPAQAAKAVVTGIVLPAGGGGAHLIRILTKQPVSAAANLHCEMLPGQAQSVIVDLCFRLLPAVSGLLDPMLRPLLAVRRGS